MGRIKKKVKDFIDVLPYFILQLSPIIALVVALLIAYWISTSNLPDWFKYFLLK